MASTAVELIREKGAALPASARERFAAEQLAVLWDMHAKGCSLAEFSVLLSLSEKYDLDINAHELWAVKGKSRDGEPGKLMILAGRDGLLTIARRQADFVTVDGDVHRKNDSFKVTRLPDGTRTVEHSYEGSVEVRGEIVGAWAMVKRKDGTFTNYTYTPLAEYLPSYNGWQKSPWGKQISAMIQKVAVSLCLRIAYGISGVVGEDEVSAQFEGPVPVDAVESLALVAADIPEDLRQRFYDAYRDAADLRPGQVSVAAVGMSVRMQSRERVVEFIGHMEAENEDARARLAEEGVTDAEVVPELGDEPKDAASEPKSKAAGVEDLRRQIAVLEARAVEVESDPGDFEETSAELDQITADIEHLEGLIVAAEQESQGRLAI